MGGKRIQIVEILIKQKKYLKTKNCFPIFYTTIFTCEKQWKVSNELQTETKYQIICFNDTERGAQLLVVVNKDS